MMLKTNFKSYTIKSSIPTPTCVPNILSTKNKYAATHHVMSPSPSFRPSTCIKQPAIEQKRIEELRRSVEARYDGNCKVMTPEVIKRINDWASKMVQQRPDYTKSREKELIRKMILEAVDFQSMAPKIDIPDVKIDGVEGLGRPLLDRYHEALRLPADEIIISCKHYDIVYTRC